jgi:hypothetical protein
VIAPNDRINQYYKIHNKLPSPNWLAVICKISIDDAKELLNEQDEKQDTNEKINLPPPFPGQAKLQQPVSIAITEPSHDGGNGIQNCEPAVAVIKQDGLIDSIVIRLIGAIKSFVFLSASLGDLAITTFFYWSLGYDVASKIIWGLWAVTQTLGKLYLWHMGYKKSATWAAVLSVIATVSIFLAVIDVQSVSVAANNNTGKSAVITSLENQLAAKTAENHTLNERLKNTPPDYIGAARALTAAITSNDLALKDIISELNIALKRNKEIQPKQLELSAWQIFSQFTNFKWSDKSHIFAFILILGIACFFEMLIYATTPRKIK